ncbi:MAG TPA: type II toxin-antitoxin system RelE/ParE family toxin [Nitrospira sp.]|nr:type II toxin-antitoxin system RelE/ParE family toxin [Nitrospira sp.]
MSSQYENHLIFYTPHKDGITIVRVLHAVRDWWSLLDLEI